MIRRTVPAGLARIILLVAVVVAVVLVLVLSGWADDKARPGSRGRGQVSTPASTNAP